MATAKPTTTLDADVTKPSVTEPGDGAHDTTDPKERASTVVPQPSAETIASGVGTVNAVLPLSPIPDAPRVESPRFEEYDAVGPDGKVVHIKRNIETGESRVVKSTETGSVQTQSATR